MRIKSYFAKSVNAAIREARQELGPEAMLIESRPSPAGARQLGDFEVVFGIIDRNEAAAGTSAPASGGDDLAAELKLLRNQIDELRRTLQPDNPAFSRSETDDVRDELSAAEFHTSVIESLLEEALPMAAHSSLRDAVRDSIHRRCGSPVWEADRAAEKQIVVVVGPPGAGKTSSLAKIAIRHFLARRRAVRIVSIDGDRAGSHERMRVFSALAGIGFTAADSITDLVAAVQQHHGRSDILIDTPGFGAAETGSAADLAQALDSFPGRDVHLVLPASMRRRDLELCAERFAGFKPHRVLITRLDETESAGAILSTALKIKTPLSFVCSGQSVPEDLEIAGIAKLTGTFLPAATQKTATAA